MFWIFHCFIFYLNLINAVFSNFFFLCHLLIRCACCPVKGGQVWRGAVALAWGEQAHNKKSKTKQCNRCEKNWKVVLIGNKHRIQIWSAQRNPHLLPVGGHAEHSDLSHSTTDHWASTAKLPSPNFTCNELFHCPSALCLVQMSDCLLPKQIGKH